MLVMWLDHLFPVACSPYCKRREAGQEDRKLLEHLLEIGSCQVATSMADGHDRIT